MTFGDLLIWLLLGTVAAGLALLAAHQLSNESRLRRRRRKNHSPLSSKARRPTVRFSVRPPKK
jgi:hypothetical protein